MKKVLIVILAVLLAAAICAGCYVARAEEGFPGAGENAPETEVAQRELAAEAGQTPQASLLPAIAEQVGAPETLKTSVVSDSGKLRVNVDAAVEAPRKETMPQVRVTAADFTAEQVRAAVDYLFGGATVYMPPEQRTKEQVQDAIGWTKERIEQEREDGDPGELVAVFERNLAELEEEAKTAPETVEQQKWDGELRIYEQGKMGTERVKTLTRRSDKTDGSITYEGINLSGDTGKAENADFFVQNNDDLERSFMEEVEAAGAAEKTYAGRMKRSNAMMVFNNYGELRNYWMGKAVPVGKDLQVEQAVQDQVGISPQEALARAEGFFDAVGTKMELYHMAVVNDENDGHVDDTVSPAQNYAYEMVFVREVEDVPSLYMAGSAMVGDWAADPENSAEWQYETCELQVDETGIISLSWMSPAQEEEVLPQSEPLLPFEQIRDIFEKMILVDYGEEADSEWMQQMNIDIDAVRLGYCRVSDADSITSGTYIPAWGFYGTAVKQYRSDGTQTEDVMGKGGSVPFLLINAIDGSIIDQESGMMQMQWSQVL